MSDQLRIPVRNGSRVEYVKVDASRSLREADRVEAERRRVSGVLKRRQYFQGTQFDELNRDAEQQYCRGDRRGQLFPEHKRFHAYSTQIEECIRFMANRISSGLRFEAEDPVVEEALMDSVQASPQLWTYDESGEKVLSTLGALLEALVAGDVAAHCVWDPVDGAVRVELWESEHVEVVQETMSGPDMVVLSQEQWRQKPNGVEIVEVRTWTYRYGDEGVEVEVAWESDDEPVEVTPLGLGRIPWVLLRGSTDGIRAVRGRSMLSEQAMRTADRYNAVEQTGYLISRYNSHANIAVVGDAALLKVEAEGKVNKDVADVLTFPGGTNLQVLQLPTDPEMIDHQRKVLGEALFSKLGVTRLDADSLHGLGAVSGYALEILNQKSQATFDSVIQQWRRDLSALFDMILDVHAWKSGDDDVEEEDGPVEGSWLDVDPADVFPNRKIRIAMGTGYVVDDVMVRNDFDAGLLSRKQALRERGYSPDQIVEIEEEIEEEKPVVPEVSLSPVAGAAARRG